MKLNKLYCNDNRFHSIIFNDGMNVVLGKVHKRYDIKKDSHNLGKSTLIDVLDFMLLKGVDSGHIFKKYKKSFAYHVFFLEIRLNDGTFLTIMRSVATPTKISFKKSQTEIVCNESTLWDEVNLPHKKAEEYLNECLSFDILANWSFRKTVTFFLRTQKDYNSVFQLGKFINGKHIDWKPVVFDLLGYNGNSLTQKYDLDQQLQELKDSEKSINAEMRVSANDFDKIKSTLELKRLERDEMQKKVDAFNFYSEERSLNRNLIEDIERRIAELNSQEYALGYELDKMKQAIENIPMFDVEQLKELYGEVEVYFPDNIVHSYEDLLSFNIKVTKERNKYLREQIEKLETDLKDVRSQLMGLNDERNQALAVLQDNDTFHKFKGYQLRLAMMEGEIARLETQLESIDKVSILAEKADKLREKLKEVSKSIAAQVRKNGGSVSSTIKRRFNEVYHSVFGVSALLYVQLNTSGNVDYKADVAPSEEAEATAEGMGNTYRKMLCVAFDLAVLSAYSDKSFFRFVYHDGVLEGLDNRKKQLFIEVARRYCETYGIQYIFSTIEDDIPSEILSSFTQEEICLELSDRDDSGKLFGFGF